MSAFAVSSVIAILNVNVVCKGVDSRQSSLLSFSSLPKSEAERDKAAAFNRAEKRWRQKAQIKQMPESSLESQLVVIPFE